MARTLRSPKLQKKRRRILIIKISLALGAAGVVMVGLVFASRIYALSIRDVQVSGNTVVETKQVTDKVFTHLEGKYLYLFSRANIALYPHDEILADLKDSFPRFELVTVSRSSFHSLLIKVVERKPKALWCKTEEESDCYVIDSNGLIFDKAPNFSEGVYFVYTGFVQGNPLNQHFLSESDFIRANTFVKGLISIGLTPTKLSYLDDSSIDIYLTGGEQILISLQDDVQKTVSNLESLIRDSTLHIYRGSELTVSLFDARYGNKIVLKRKTQ